MVLLVLDDLLGGPNGLLDTILFQFGLAILLHDLMEVVVLFHELCVLSLDLLLELIHLVRHTRVPLGEFSYFLLTLEEVLGVEITVTK